MSVRITIDQSNQINSRDVLSSGYKELLINKKLWSLITFVLK